MASHKRSARARQKSEFMARLEGPGEGAGGLDDAFDAAFAREEERQRHDEEERERALRLKACESKNRYATLEEARENLAWCEARGVRGLHIYRCPYCKGYHLTSHPQKPR